MNILDHIIANKLIEVAEAKAKTSISELEKSPFFDREILSIKDFVLSKSGIISEIKKKSPSGGNINDEISVEEVGEGYEAAGASAISVLTDFKYFGGKSDDLTQVRNRVDIPVLRKDFVVDEYQIIEAKAIGADFILLIAANLEPEKLKSLAKFAKSLDLGILMEVHNREELDRSLCPELDLVGVNNRNLKTFEVSIQNSIDLVEHIPNEFIKISESGLKDVATIHQLKDVGYQGFLIGETFMKTDDPAKALSIFIKEIEDYK